MPYSFNTKVVRKLGLRTLIVAVIVYASWLTILAPAPTARDKTSRTTSSLQPFLETGGLRAELAKMSLTGLKLRDKGSVEQYYQDAAAAQSLVENNLSRTRQSNQTLRVWPLFDRGLYSKLTREIDSAAQLKISFQEPYARAAGLFGYYRANILALYNIFYYDPSKDLGGYLQSNNYKVLVQNFGMARDGLQKTAQAIKSVSGYPDPTLASFVPEINSLATQAGQISRLGPTNPDEATGLARIFDDQILSLQERLLADRQHYWGGLAVRLEVETSLSKISNESGREIARLVDLQNKLPRQ